METSKLTEQQENNILDFIEEHEEYIQEECYEEVKEQTTFCEESADDGCWVAVSDCWTDEDKIKELCINYFKDNYNQNATEQEIQFFLNNLDIPSFEDMIDSAKEDYCDRDDCPW